MPFSTSHSQRHAEPTERELMYNLTARVSTKTRAEYQPSQSVVQHASAHQTVGIEHASKGYDSHSNSTRIKGEPHHDTVCCLAPACLQQDDSLNVMLQSAACLASLRCRFTMKRHRRDVLQAAPYGPGDLRCACDELGGTCRKGWAARAADPISKGSFVCQYAGELLTSSEAAARLAEYDARPAYQAGHALMVIAQRR